MASENVKMISKDNFEQEVVKAEVPVLVDFWAPWCGPCRMLGPIIDEIADGIGPKAKICKVNVDEEGQLAGKFQVMSIPTVAIFKNGEMVEKMVGLRTREVYEEALDKLK